MLQASVFIFWIIFITNIHATKLVGSIRNTSYYSTDTKVVITYNNNCSECICNVFFSNLPPLYVGLNCYKNNKTCELFSNYSTSATIQINVNSTFIFIQQPPLQNRTTGNYTSIFLL